MATKKTSDGEIIRIKPLEMKTVELKIEGTSPLITHKWSEKAKRELLGTSLVKQKLPRNMFADAATASWFMEPEKDPFRMRINGGPVETFEEWCEKYKSYGEEDFIRDFTGARIGFPATAIKKAAISAAYRLEMVKNKVCLQGLFFIKGFGTDELVEIEHDGLPGIREDNCKVGMGTADIRYRPQFENWSATLQVSYMDGELLTLEKLVNLINIGGQVNGIGEWRVEKSGQFGMFRVANQ